MSGGRNNVRRVRERKRWTLKTLATVMGNPSLVASLSKIERGIIRPNGITRERIAEALGVSREELFPEDAEETVA